MKNKFGMIFMLMTSFGCVQASSRPSSVNSNQDSNELIKINEEYSKLLSQPKQQAVFFAIRQGLDEEIINALFQAAVKNSPSQEFNEVMRQEVVRVIKTDSPHIRNLQYRISGRDGTRALEREQLREELESLQNS